MLADTPFLNTHVLARRPARIGPDAVTFSLSSRIREVEHAWRELEKFGIESPGQSFDFNRAWVSALRIPRAAQIFVTAHLGSRPVALLALMSTRRFGCRILTFIPGSHVGCNAPLVDPEWFGTLKDAQRKVFWAKLLATLPAADAVYLPAVPALFLDRFDLFAGLGMRAGRDRLYRSRFSSWAECDTTMRKSKQRKRDRQQGEKLAALGTVSFGAAEPAEFETVLATMFEQKSKRFEALGIDDPFADPACQAAYLEVLRGARTLKPELFVLRVDGRIAAIRYALGHGDRLFALISAMSEDAVLQSGSPGRQEIFRTVQSVFDRGYRMLDIGLGINDEKRSWCNAELEVFSHYFPRTPMGFGFMATRRSLDWLKAKVKGNPRFSAIHRRLRGVLPRALRT